jgi:hypothetical protein
MDIDTSALFAPIVINGHTVRNRLSVAPMFVRGRKSSRPLRRPRFRMINGSELRTVSEMVCSITQHRVFQLKRDDRSRVPPVNR